MPAILSQQVLQFQTLPNNLIACPAYIPSFYTNPQLLPVIQYSEMFILHVFSWFELEKNDEKDLFLELHGL